MPGLFGRVSMLWLIAGLGVLAYLIFSLSSGKYADFEDIPRGVFLSLDHFNFVGVMAMVILGHVARAIVPTQRHEWWILGGVNVGLVLFAAGFLTETPWLERIGTRLMGLSLIWGIWTYVTKLRSTDADQFDAQPVMAA